MYLQFSRGFFLIWPLVQWIDYSSYRLIFYLDKKDEIYHYSSKEHPKITKIAKFGCENL